MKEEARQRQSSSKKQTRINEHYVYKAPMENRKPSKLFQQLGKGMTAFLVFGACILFYFALLRMDVISSAIGTVVGVLKPVIYGLVIAYILNPIMVFVEKHLETLSDKYFPNMKNTHKVCRGIGIAASIIVLLAIIVALFNMMIPELYRSIRNLAVTLPGQLNEAIDHLSDVMSGETALGQFFKTTLEEATAFLENWVRTDLLKQVNVMMSGLTVGVINVVSELFNLLIGLIISIYVLFGKETFSKQSKKNIYAIFPVSKANMILHLTAKGNQMFGGFIIGKIIDSAIIGVLCFIGLSVMKMPYTLLVSVIVGVTNVIPFFGPYIGAIPSAVLIMLSDPKMGIYFIIFILILQQLDGNIIGPKIIGDSTGLSAFWVVFAILLGGGLFGIVGMIMGVPAFAVIYYAISLFIDSLLERKNLPTDTECYDEMSYVSSDGKYVSSKMSDDPKESSGANDAGINTEKGE